MSRWRVWLVCLAVAAWCGAGCASRRPTSTEALGRGYLAECRGDWSGAASSFRLVAVCGGTVGEVTEEERLAALEGLARASVALGCPGEALRLLGTLPGTVTTAADCRRLVLAAKLVAASGQVQDADRMMVEVAGALSVVRGVPVRLRVEVLRWAGEAALRERQFEESERWLSGAVEAARASGDAESLGACRELLRVVRAQRQNAQGWRRVK